MDPPLAKASARLKTRPLVFTTATRSPKHPRKPHRHQTFVRYRRPHDAVELHMCWSLILSIFRRDEARHLVVWMERLTTAQYAEPRR